MLGILAGLFSAETREAALEGIKRATRLGRGLRTPRHELLRGHVARVSASPSLTRPTPRSCLLDEVHEALDHAYRQIVAERAGGILSRGGIVVAAGHDHPLLETICDRALWMEGGSIVRDGPFEEVEERLPQPRRTMTREASDLPLIAMVGWKLGGELEGAIREGTGRFRYAVVSMALDPEIRPLVEWHRMPCPRLELVSVPVDRLLHPGWPAPFAPGGSRPGAHRGPDADRAQPGGPQHRHVLPRGLRRRDRRAMAEGQLKQWSAGGWASGWLLTLERWWFRRARVLGGISAGGVADLRRCYPDREVVLTPRGIDTARFRPDPAARTELRDEEGVAGDSVVALFVDQAHRPLKGLDLAIEGFAEAVRSGRGPGLAVGARRGQRRPPGPGRGSRRGRPGCGFSATASTSSGCTRPRTSSSCPPHTRPSAGAAHEAAACGLPVVAPPVPGIRELIGEDEAGILAGREAGEVAECAGGARRRSRAPGADGRGGPHARARARDRCGGGKRRRTA